MKRRQILVACATGVTGVAGCVSTGDDTNEGRTPDTSDEALDNSSTSQENSLSGKTAGTDNDSNTTPTGQDTALAVTLEALQPGIPILNTDAIAVSGRRESDQYLFLALAVQSGEPPARTDFRFQFDGQEYPPSDATTASDLYRLYLGSESRYDADSGSGWVLFELPETGDASDAALAWSGGRWEPDETLRERLAVSFPSLSLNWSVPSEITPNTQTTVEFSVSNETDRDGRFVAGLNRTGPSIAYAPIKSISRRIPAQETVSWTVTDDFRIEHPGSEQIGDGEPDMTYRLNWTQGNSKREISIVENSE